MLALRRPRGFTLLEVLVSLSLSAVILASLLTGLQLSQKAWKRGNERLAGMAHNLGEGEAIQAQMNSAIPRVLNFPYEQRQVQLITFRGDAKQVLFLSNYSWGGGRNSGLWLARYRVVPESEGKERLLISETGLALESQLVNFFLSDTPQPAQSLYFGDAADRIEISYLRPSSPGTPAAWVQEWNCQERKQLPPGVRIHWQRGNEGQDLLLVIPVTGQAQ